MTLLLVATTSPSTGESALGRSTLFLGCCLAHWSAAGVRDELPSKPMPLHRGAHVRG